MNAFHIGLTIGFIATVCAHTYCIVILWRECKKRLLFEADPWLSDFPSNKLP